MSTVDTFIFDSYFTFGFMVQQAKTDFMSGKDVTLDISKVTVIDFKRYVPRFIHSFVDDLDNQKNGYSNIITIICDDTEAWLNLKELLAEYKICHVHKI